MSKRTTPRLPTLRLREWLEREERMRALEREARLVWRGALMQVLQAQLALRAELREAAKLLARPV